MFKGEGLRNGGAPHGEGAPRGGIRAFWVPISSKERRNKKIASGTPREGALCRFIHPAGM